MVVEILAEHRGLRRGNLELCLRITRTVQGIAPCDDLGIRLRKLRIQLLAVGTLILGAGAHVSKLLLKRLERFLKLDSLVGKAGD